MPYEKAPSSGAFLPLSLMHILSGEPMHDLSGVDTLDGDKATKRQLDVTGVGEVPVSKTVEIISKLLLRDGGCPGRC